MIINKKINCCSTFDPNTFSKLFLSTFLLVSSARSSFTNNLIVCTFIHIIQKLHKRINYLSSLLIQKKEIFSIHWLKVTFQTELEKCDRNGTETKQQLPNANWLRIALLAKSLAEQFYFWISCAAFDDLDRCTLEFLVPSYLQHMPYKIPWYLIQTAQYSAI